MQNCRLATVQSGLFLRLIIVACYFLNVLGVMLQVHELISAVRLAIYGRLPWLALCAICMFLPAGAKAVNSPRRPIDVLHYTLWLHPDIATQTLAGEVEIRFRFLPGSGPVVFDLDTALRVESVVLDGLVQSRFVRQGALIELDYALHVPAHTYARVRIKYRGKPRAARKPPWDGGLVWAQTNTGKPWVGVACQQDGASLWWPCKDDVADEPDSGATILCDAPLGLTAVANGRQTGPATLTADGKGKTWRWDVTYPINPYCITINIGPYSWQQAPLSGPAGPFEARVWLLKEDSTRGFDYLWPRIRQMMDGYQALFGAYPFTRDGYQLVQTPYWGMEHQSAVAYGNGFRPDGFGLDFILIHETGHEWWGNRVSVADPADLWVHEAFCTYGEALLCERLFGKAAMQQYLASQRKRIENKSPLQGPRGVRYHGWQDADIYFRGAALLHTLRLLVGDSTKFMGALQRVLARQAFVPTYTEDVVQILAQELGAGPAAFLQYALGLAHPPRLRYAATKGGYKVWLEGYTGPPLPLTGLSVSGKAVVVKAKPALPPDWLIEVRQAGK